jgi:hypothetical protein
MTNLTADSLIRMANNLFAPTIRATELCVEQYRFPKTRKRRIRAKWAKRPANWRPARRGYLDTAHNVLYVHPDTLAQMNP